jgi:hypothetical protein
MSDSERVIVIVPMIAAFFLLYWFSFYFKTDKAEKSSFKTDGFYVRVWG